MPYYVFGAYGRAGCLALLGAIFWFGGELPTPVLTAVFLALWTAYAFVSGIVAVPYNDIVGRSIPSNRRSRMLAWRFFGGGAMALLVAVAIDALLDDLPLLPAYAVIFVLAAVLMVLSSSLFVSAGEPPILHRPGVPAQSLREFLSGGWHVLRVDSRFRLFLYSQWLGGATLMALPFYIVAAIDFGVGSADVAVILGAQTAGALSSNALWGRIGDAYGKLRLLVGVAIVRLVPPVVVLVFIALDADLGLLAFAALFVVIGALINGTTIGYLGYLMEISPDDRRPAYAAYFNVMASPAALLPLGGAALIEFVSMQAVFLAAAVAAFLQLLVLSRLASARN
ncbi:MAG: MFS transporter [Alphaproteobacteria bacterium]